MPIYEFACSKCRVIFSFLSKRINPERLPVCPKCGSRKMQKQVTGFAALRKTKEPGSEGNSPDSGPDLDDPRIMRAMAEMEKDMAGMDENNPRHLAQMMRKMKNILPDGTMPKEFETAIKRLEAGEDPEKIEADMGDMFGDFLGDEPGSGQGGGGFSRDSGLYDY